MSDSLARDGQDGSDDSDVDVEHVKELVGFVTGAPKRHPRLAIVIFVFTVIAGVAGSLTVPKWWAAEVSILIKKNVGVEVATQNRQNDRNNDDPMRGAYEEVMQHDNLIALVREGHIIERSQKKRGTLGRLRDRITASFRPAGPINTGEIEEALASLLGHKTSVNVEGSALKITMEWYDAESAFELVKIAQKRFLDGRYQQEVSGIADGIALLEEHAKAERQAVDDALQQFEQAKTDTGRSTSGTTNASASTSTPGTTPAPSPRPSVGHVRGAPDPDLARAVEDKRRQIRELEDDRQRRLAELKNQLAGLMATYTPAHPAVVALQSKIDALQEEPAQLTQLKNEERALLMQIAAATEKATEGGGSTGGSIARLNLGGGTSRSSDSPLSAETLSLRDPVAGLALRNLQTAIRKYEEFMDKITAAKLQLDVAKAAFQQRYAIFKPAEMPQAPRKGNPTLLIFVGILAAFLLAIAGPVIADVASGRFIEAWQVKRRLGLPLLGEVTRP